MKRIAQRGNEWRLQMFVPIKHQILATKKERHFRLSFLFLRGYQGLLSPASHIEFIILVVSMIEFIILFLNHVRFIIPYEEQRGTGLLSLPSQSSLLYTGCCPVPVT